MIIEAIDEPILYRWPWGAVLLEPLKPVNLPEDRARRLIAKIPGKVRLVERSFPQPDERTDDARWDDLRPGTTVEYESPVFGRLSAEIVHVGSSDVEVFHPLRNRMLRIPKRWLMR